jgi:hypothetical protein
MTLASYPWIELNSLKLSPDRSMSFAVLCAIYLPLRQFYRLLIQNNLASLTDWICAQYRNNYWEYTEIHMPDDLRDSLSLAWLPFSSANGTRWYVAGIVVGTRACERRCMVS